MNRIVVEVDRTGHLGHKLQAKIRAEHPSDVTVIFIDKLLADYVSDYEPSVYGDGGLPVETLAVVGEEVRFEVQP